MANKETEMADPDLELGGQTTKAQETVDKTSGPSAPKHGSQNSLSFHQQKKSGALNDREKSKLEKYLEALDSCTNNQEGFDVYQLLAFRKMEALRIEETRRIKKDPEYKKKPYRLSEYHESVITVIIIGLLQTFGITLILMEVMAVYFFPDAYDVAEEDRSDFECEIGAGHWDNASEVLYKLLAFLFATMISINLGKAIYTIETNGFNMVLSKDFALHQLEETDRGQLAEIFQVADLTMIQTGIVINIYALFLAVFGSFFLIYASEDGADSLDMVFNSLALFFLIELDDLLVQENDYSDVADYVKPKLERLKAQKPPLPSVSEEPEEAGADTVTAELQVATEGLELKCCSFPCSYRCFRRYENCSDAIQMVVVIIVYVAAVIGPFAVSLCW